MNRRRNNNNCVVTGCHNKFSPDQKISLFMLPKCPNRRNQWLEAIGRPELLNKKDLKYNSYRICSVHFENYFLTDMFTRKLSPEAVPTKYLTGTEPPPPQPTSVHKRDHVSKIQTEDHCLSMLSAIKSEPNDQDDTERRLADCKHLQSTSAFATSMLHEEIIIKMDPSGDQDTQTRSGMPNNKILQKELCESEKKRRLAYDLEKIKRALDVNKSTNNNDDKITKSPLSKKFHNLLHYRKSLSKKYKNNRYDVEFKYFALNKLLSRPHLYRSLISLLKLPSESTLSKLKLNIRPGLEPRVLNALSSKLQSLPKLAEYCTICVAKMDLKSHLYYDIKHDEIVGFHNINGNMTNKLASDAYVIMLRGIAIDWNQPIAYACLASIEHFQKLDEWMNDVITKLFTAGLKPMAIVSAQGSGFEKYAKEIKEVAIDKPYFIINGNKIYYIFDVPDLLNTVRDNLLTNDFSYDNELISWTYIKALHCYQKQHKLSLIPRVTDAHINPNSVQRTRVKYAAQVFSLSVHGALKTFIYTEHLPEEAAGTAEFVKLLNNLFDVLNSSTNKNSNKYYRPFTLSKDQIEVMEAAQKLFKKIIAIRGHYGINVSATEVFDNFQITMQAIMELSNELQKKNIIIFTRRLNLEPLEMFVRAVRQKDKKTKKPTPIQFRRAFSTLFLRSIMQSHTSSYHSADLRDILLEGNRMLKEIERLRNHPKPLKSSVTVSLNGETDYRIDLPAQNGLMHVAAFLLHKCSLKHQCVEFDSYLNHCINSIKNPLFYLRPQSLPETFLRYIKKLETTFMRNIHELVLSRLPANALFTTLCNIYFPAPCSCFPFPYLLRLYVRLRLYLTLKYNNKWAKELMKHSRGIFLIQKF